MREDQRRECRDRRRQEGRSTRRESQIPGDPEPWEEGHSWEHSLAVADFTLEEKPNSTLGAEHNLQREPCREQMQLHDWN